MSVRVHTKMCETEKEKKRMKDRYLRQIQEQSTEMKRNSERLKCQPFFFTHQTMEMRSCVSVCGYVKQLHPVLE